MAIPRKTWRTILGTVLWLALIAGVLGAVFAAYHSPARMVELADRVWAACFG